MQYRREIDGLRALAVLPVILYHAGIGPFGGGFVGVDVFFVISGYLITSLIAEELAAGTFSLKAFYERRARRLLPALFVVLAVCIPVAYAWLLPGDLRRFAHSLVATVLFASNLYFAGEPSGYFDSTAELQPLLHTWSLAVEEHYYLLFPLLLMVMWRFGRVRVTALVAGAALASFALAVWLTPRSPALSFYLLPTRGWELAAGALVALLARPAAPGSAGERATPAAQAGALAGLLLLASAVLTFDNATPWPSVWTLVPVAGTVLLVACGTQHTAVGRVLGTRLLVGIGLISYSAYLWHQPLFAFARQRSFEAPSTSLLLALAVLSLLLAAVTWRYVERPFRDRARFTRRQVVQAASWAAMLTVQAGVTFILFSGFPERLPAEATTTLAAVSARIKASEDGCSVDKGESALRGCVRGDRAARPRTALIGDSHAGMLVPTLDRAFATRGASFVQMTKFGCPVAAHFARAGPGGPTCATFQRNVMAALASNPDLDSVVVVVRWPNYVFGKEEYDNGEGGVSVGIRDALSSGELPFTAPATTRQAAMLADYTDSVRQLVALGKRVVLVYPIPEQGWNIASVYAKGLWFAHTPAHPYAVSLASYQARNAGVIAALDAVGTAPNLVRVFPAAALCDTLVPGRCAAQHDGVLLYSDDNHLTEAGAAYVVEAIVEVLFGASGRPVLAKG